MLFLSDVTLDVISNGIDLAALATGSAILGEPSRNFDFLFLFYFVASIAKHHFELK